jgi:hypothetical protein
VTPVGTATGAPATATIGTQGGTLTSPDGVLKLTVPPRAVTTNTQFSIQPITNLAPGGVAGGYRLLPEGQTFLAPVELALAYTDQHLAGSAPEALGVAFQDAQSQWHKLKTIVLDTTAKTVKGTTTHFSDWVAVRTYQIVPSTATVGPSDKLTLKVIVCESVEFGDPNETLLAVCNPDGNNAQAVPATDWAVNGVVGGAAATGTIQPVDTTNTSALYTAPPLPCPSFPLEVEVSARIDARTLLKAKVTIVPHCGGVFQPFPGYGGTTSWKNTLNDTGISGTITGNAQMNWELASVTGRIARYLLKTGMFVVGSDEATLNGIRCTTTYSTSSLAMTPTNTTAELEVDFTLSQPKFKIDARTTIPNVTRTQTCFFGGVPISTNFGPEDALFYWTRMEQSLPANVDGSTLSGKSMFSWEPNPGQVVSNEADHSYQAIRTTQ